MLNLLLILKYIELKLSELLLIIEKKTYANIVFDFNRKGNVALIQDYLKSVGIISIGRFGEWDYFWSDQSLLSGIKGANRIIENEI